MHPNLTEIADLLDRSGSMVCMINAAIADSNEFFTEQWGNTAAPQPFVPLCDDRFRKSFDRFSLEKAKSLKSGTWDSWGCTALLSVTGMKIKTVNEQRATIQEQERPASVVRTIADRCERKRARLGSPPKAGTVSTVPCPPPLP